MGEVRSTLESPTEKSPVVKLEALREELADLLTIKKRDLETEGAAARAGNQRSVLLLEAADFHVREAVALLRRY